MAPLAVATYLCAQVLRQYRLLYSDGKDLPAKFVAIGKATKIQHGLVVSLYLVIPVALRIPYTVGAGIAHAIGSWHQFDGRILC